MMRSVVIAVFLMVVGAVSSILNYTGILPMAVPGSDILTTVDDSATIQQLTTDAINSEAAALGGVPTYLGVLGIVFDAVKSSLFIAPLLMAYGVPAWIAWPLNAPIWFIYAHDLLNWKANRQLS